VEQYIESLGSGDFDGAMALRCTASRIAEIDAAQFMDEVERIEQSAGVPLKAVEIEVVADSRLRPASDTEMQRGLRFRLKSGHPGVVARRTDGHVLVSAQADEFPEEIVAAVAVPVERIRAAADQGLIVIHEFATRLERRLFERGIEPTAFSVPALGGLNCHERQSRCLPNGRRRACAKSSASCWRTAPRMAFGKRDTGCLLPCA
ncbi:MAG TPA: hypothetical protein VMM60_11245, partial [Ilumatobacter sp.]|nr:hypothetical protein [Ilumatobacter sp.]